MPRNPSGDFNLSTSPVISGEVIEASWANTSFADVSAALTDSLSRSGQGNMSAAFLSIDGTKAAPGIAFVNEAGTGFYRPDAGDLYLSVLGVDYMRWTDDNGVQLFIDPDWVDVANQDDLDTAIADLQAQISQNAVDIAALDAAGIALNGRVTDLEDNVTPDPIISPNFRSNGSIRHLLNVTTTVDVRDINRTVVNNNGGVTLSFTGLPSSSDPALGNKYQVEGQVVIYNGSPAGNVNINGLTADLTLGVPSTADNEGSVLSYLIQYNGGTVTTTLIWSAG